jgi:hypothetical protein
MCLAGVIAASA